MEPSIKKSMSVFAIFSGILLFNILFFQWVAFHSFVISSLWKNPLIGFAWWLPKIGITILLASITFFFRKNWWTIFVCFFINLWILANLMYWRSNGIFINGYALSMTSNMDGYWSSIWALCESKDIIPFVGTILYACILCLIEKKYPLYHWKIGIVGLTISLIICLFANTLVKRKLSVIESCGVGNKEWKFCYNPYAFTSRQELFHMGNNYALYDFSICHSFLFALCEYGDVLSLRTQDILFTDDEEECIQQHSGLSPSLTYHNPLIIILVESLESWAIHPDIMPYLYQFIQSHPVGYFKHVQSQIKGGSSSDGQLIIQTGLLPITEGATCFRFPYNKYPSLTNTEDSSIVVLTHGKTVWNQELMSKAYGYRDIQEGGVEDSILSERLIKAINGGAKTILGITVASHLPFSYAEKSQLVVPEDMPKDMGNYMKCLNWTDEGLSVFLQAIDTIAALKHATICITGDHSIFWPERRDLLEEYCISANLQYDISSATCPVIIYSPDSIQNTLLDERLHYQMDIYPTLLYLIGGQDYMWQGWGQNMLKRQQFEVPMDEYYYISNKMIKSNYFQK